MSLTKYTDYEIETREALVRYITRYLEMQLIKVNSAFRFLRIETPILVPFNVKPGEAADVVILVNGRTMLRQGTLDGSYEASQEILDPQADVKFRLPLVIWQSGKIFKGKPIREIYALEYHLLYSNRTAADYMPIVTTAVDEIVKSQCGNALSSNAVSVCTASGFWAGKCIEVSFNMDEIVRAYLTKGD